MKVRSRLWTVLVFPAGVLSAVACSTEEARDRDPVRELLATAGAIDPGSTVKDAETAITDLQFTPYDGLTAPVRTEFFGFRSMRFFTGELFPERAPHGSVEVEEVHFVGDSINGDVERQLSELLKRNPDFYRCINETNTEVAVWQGSDRGTLTLELMLARGRSQHGRLRVTRGSWKGDPLTRRSDESRCAGPR